MCLPSVMQQSQGQYLLESLQGKGNSRVQDNGAGDLHLAESISHGQAGTVWPPLCHHYTELHALHATQFDPIQNLGRSHCNPLDAVEMNKRDEMTELTSGEHHCNLCDKDHCDSKYGVDEIIL